jgi:hypothetical protein
MEGKMITKNKAADAIARKHSSFDEDLIQVCRIAKAVGEDSPDEPVKLLEVNASTVPVGVVPVYFGPSSENPFPTIIVEITPTEYQQLLAKQLSLPDDWRLGESLYSRMLEKSAG